MPYKTSGITHKNFSSPDLKVVNQKGQSACWEFIRGEPGIYLVSEGVPIEKFDTRQRRTDGY